MNLIIAADLHTVRSITYRELFEPAYLRHDDWQPVDFTLKGGRTTRGLARPSVGELKGDVIFVRH